MITTQNSTKHDKMDYVDWFNKDMPIADKENATDSGNKTLVEALPRSSDVSFKQNETIVNANMTKLSKLNVTVKPDWPSHNITLNKNTTKIVALNATVEEIVSSNNQTITTTKQGTKKPKKV